jgi:hypothetical protein
MKTKHYLTLCGVISVALVVALLFVPGLSNTIEQLLLAFLSTNAR